MVKSFAMVVAGVLMISAAVSQQVSAKDGTAAKWSLTWSDEFNGPNGSAPDPAKWTFDLGGNGWGNQEQESYTDRPQNVHQENGNLVITAINEHFAGKDGIAREYTSARLKSEGLFAQKYGRFEARMKIPKGQGMWPAFWMLGEDIETFPWPKCGEIDIMENIGKEPNKIHGSLHGPSGAASTNLTGIDTLPDHQNFGDDFHLFAVEWEPDAIRFYVDDRLYETQARTVQSQDTPWVYDHPYFILLNLAVGGGWPGNPDATTAFPQSMLVDYVRVYSRQPSSVAGTAGLMNRE